MALLKRKRSSLTDPMSVVTRFVNACNRHDADGIYACLHPDFDSIQPMYPARNFRGADQVRRNWQAIFDAEPGFRLTVLRQAAADDTVWLELHGAGDEAEVAGVFVMGIQGDRVRWARIYSALVEPLPPGMEPHVPSSPATLRGVPPLREGDGATVASEPVVEEDLIAPVVDIEDSGRSRRRRRRRGHEPADAPVAAAEDEAVDVAPVEDDAEPETASREAAEAALEDLLAEPDVVPAPTAAQPEPAAQTEAAPAPEPEPQPEPEPEPVVTSRVEPIAEPVAEPLEEREPEVVAEPVVAPVEEVTVVVEPAAGPEPGDVPPPPPEAAVPAEPEPEATAEPATPERQPLGPVTWPEPTATAVVEPAPEPTAIVEPAPEPEPVAEPTSHPDDDDDDDGSSGKRRGWLRR